jgi:hypothetical protein
LSQFITKSEIIILQPTMITTPFSHPSFASWKEYFLHLTDVDQLNITANRILHFAYHSTDATVELCLYQLSTAKVMIKAYLNILKIILLRNLPISFVDVIISLFWL